MAEQAETGIELPPPQMEAPQAQSIRIQYMRASTAEGRVFELGRRWPPAHPGQKIDLGIIVDQLALRYGDDGAYWQFRGKPKAGSKMAQDGKVITCDVAVQHTCAEGLISIAEYERLQAERAKSDAAFLERMRQQLRLDRIPGYSKKIITVSGVDRRLFSPKQQWPQFHPDPKREFYFKGVVRSIQLVGDDRGVYYEIIGDPLPGTAPHEKKKLLICEMADQMCNWSEAVWQSDDLEAHVQASELPEDHGPTGPEDDIDPEQAAAAIED